MATGNCPDPAVVLDFIGYGAPNCSEGTAIGALSLTTGALRNQAGCADTNVNNQDVAIDVPAPRNSGTAAAVCACTVQNESNGALEADYCNVQSPTSLTVPTASSTGMIFGQLFESSVTDPAGAPANVRAQLGYGPASANPEYQAGFTWINATYNVQAGNNDEYQASFTAPAAGSYRYVYRFSLDQGVSWTYCDRNEALDFGAGSNANLSFELADESVLTVTP